MFVYPYIGNTGNPTVFDYMLYTTITTNLSAFRTVQQLIRYDSKLAEIPDADGRNALHLACQGGHLNVVCALGDCLSEHVLEACDNKGNRPLHVACESNSADIVKLLVEMKADTTARNQRDDVPLLIAALEGNVEIGRLVLSALDLASIKDSHGFNPLHNAVRYNKIEMIEFLCQRYLHGIVLLITAYNISYHH